MYFFLFFTDDLLNLIVTETNRYARQFRNTAQGTLKRFSSFRRLADTTNSEMKAIIAIVMKMDLNQRPLLQKIGFVINLRYIKNTQIINHKQQNFGK